MYGYCHQLFRLPCTKHLALSQGFDVRLPEDCYTVLASSYGVDVKILSDSCNPAFNKTCHQARLLCQDTAGPLFSPVRILITGDTSKQSVIGKLLPSSYKKNKLSI